MLLFREVTGHYARHRHTTSQGYSLRNSWTPAEVETAVAGRRRLWLFYNTRYSVSNRLDLPYPLLATWRAGHLELRLYGLPSSGMSGGREWPEEGVALA
jgi:hypothetical protein